ncbi:hypothetical protein GCM10010462_05420 [Microbacterium dextranolyticum]|uniref:Uncharacterized protein n=1 Tax=Microbacterium dextranolyticum TaxID=36806 RepID=A0A9W6HMJ8_9MICO|nr:hypothetical protein GCM10017591_20100 [Microbacterium dextranolyticum]
MGIGRRGQQHEAREIELALRFGRGLARGVDGLDRLAAEHDVDPGSPGEGGVPQSAEGSRKVHEWSSVRRAPSGRRSRINVDSLNIGEGTGAMFRGNDTIVSLC